MKMLIEGVDYFVRVIPFPDGVKVPAMVTENPDGCTFSVYLNENVSEYRRQKGLEHEVNHIRNDDLYGDKDICEIEPGLRRGA